MSTILIVEDDIALCDLLHTQLEADGYTVHQAFDGIAALAAVEQYHPHLIILDWMLPGIDGLTICRRLRQKYLTPIIMLTARAEEVDYILGLEVGADDYICKPFSILQLQARIRAILRRVDQYSQSSQSKPSPSQSQQTSPIQDDAVSLSTPLSSGALSIHQPEHLVKVDGQRIELTPKEYDLLVLLISHPNWVFKREILLQQVWGDSYEGFDRTVDNHITRLRKKLGPIGNKIDTVWGIGYRFLKDNH